MGHGGPRAKAPAKGRAPASKAPAPATKRCPYCAETVQAAAIKCRYCGSSLVPRRLSVSSPWLGIASLAIGMAGGVAEILSLAGVNKGSSGGGRPFFPTNASDSHDGTHVALLVAALVVGLAGLAGALLVRRRPGAGIATLLAAGATGLAVTFFVGKNVILIVLSALLILAAVGAGVAVERTRAADA